MPAYRNFSSLHSKRFCGVWEQRKTEEWGFRCFSSAKNGAPFFTRVKHRKSRFSDFLCSLTPRKRLLCRLRVVALLKSPYLTYRARPRNSTHSKNIRAKQGNILSVDNGMQFTGRKLFLTDRHKLHGP